MNNRWKKGPVLARCMVLSALLLVSVPAALHAQSLPWTEPEAVGFSSERLTRIAPILNGYVEGGQLAGGVALVARRGKLVYLEAFGQRDREADSPMREDAIFRIASQTKALTSVAVMMLHEEGRLLLSDPLGRYLPEFMETTVAVPDESGESYEIRPAKRPITIRDLLTHTAGIGDGLGFGLGFYVVEDLGARGVPGSVGEFGWGGAYNSTYWVDPEEELVVVYLSQLIPARGLDDQRKLRALIYQALVN